MREVRRYDVDTDEQGRLVTAVTPPPRSPHIRSDKVERGELVGRRVLIVDAMRWMFDVRAVSEVHDSVVDVVDEEVWYQFKDAPDGFPTYTVVSIGSTQVWTD